MTPLGLTPVLDSSHDDWHKLTGGLLAGSTACNGSGAAQGAANACACLPAAHACAGALVAAWEVRQVGAVHSGRHRVPEPAIVGEGPLRSKALLARCGRGRQKNR